MEEKERLEQIVEPLLEWYKKNKRELPWRKQKEAYHIWISEIMLQQTRIEAVKNYYNKFMEEIPTIEALANIEEGKLLKLWEGLGYYSRARNLKKAAQVMMENYQGNMPNTYEKLIELPGIGEYTAGAIASIAYQEKVPAIDGNVLRVISRIIASKEDILFAKTKKVIEKKVTPIIPKESGDFNEALMELGELVCIPNGSPLCHICPVQKYCIAYQTGQTLKIPIREKKGKRRKEEKTVFILRCKEKIAIVKRSDTGLLASMYEFPNVKGFFKEEEIKVILNKWKLKIEKINQIGKSKHIFSHVEWNMLGVEIRVEQENDMFQWVLAEQLKEIYAIPTAFKKIKEYILLKGK